MSQIIVTGGSGFIGLNIVERLLADGADVLLLDANALPERAVRDFAKLPGTLEMRRCDVADAASLRAAIRAPADAIIHAAAITSSPAREAADAARIVSVNIGGAANVAEVAAERGVARVLFISTGGVFGTANTGGRSEGTQPAPDSLYGITKYSAEMVMRRVAELRGLRLTVCRLGWVFGPWEYSSGVRDTLSPIFQLTAAMMNGGNVTLPRADVRGWTYSRDVAAAIAGLMRLPQPRQPIYHIASGMQVDLATWGQRLEAACPGSRCIVGESGKGSTIDLFGDGTTPEFVSDTLAAELDMPWTNEDAAFREYFDWLRADAWPLHMSGR